MRAQGSATMRSDRERDAPALLNWARAHRDTLTPLAIALGARLLVFVAASALMRLVLVTKLPELRTISLALAWSRMDANWYLRIAQSGYTYSLARGSGVNFFPLYPALIALGGRGAQALGLPAPYLLVGMAISWVTFALACLLLYRLILQRFADRRVALGAVILLATFPFSFYYGAAFTEALYLLLAVGAFLAVERERWWLAAGLAGLAGAVRPPGLLVGACVALAYGLGWLRARRWGWGWRRDLFAFTLLPLGTLAYLLYCWARFGDPLAYIKTGHAGWHEGLQLNALILAWKLVSDASAWRLIIHPEVWIAPKYLYITSGMLYLALLLVCLITIPFIWRLLGLEYAVFSALSVLTPLVMFPTFASLGRYLSVVFPMFIVLAYPLRRYPLLLALIAGLSLVALCGYAALFIGGFGLP